MSARSIALGVLIGSSIVAGGYAALANGVGPVRYDPLGMFDSALVRACEDALKRRLAAPSSYSRVEIEERTIPITTDQWAELQSLTNSHESEALIEFRRQQADYYGRSPAILSAHILFEEPNAFGVPLRHSAACHYLSDDGQFANSSWSSVRIDGLTHTDWLAERSRQITQ